MKFTLLFLFNISCLFAAENFKTPTSFSNLAARLSGSEKKQIPYLDSYIAAAQNDDLFNQYYLSKRLYRIEKLKPIALDLIVGIYHKNGFAITPREERYIFEIYSDLAIEYIYGKNIEPQPKKGFQLLVKIANSRDKLLMLTLLIALSDSHFLPEHSLSLFAWDDFSENTKKSIVNIDELIVAYNKYYEMIENEQGVLEEPESHLFKKCENQFNKDYQLLKLFDKKQEIILADNTVTKADLKNAYDQLSLSERISLNFNNINENNIFSLLVDFMGMSTGQQYSIKFLDNSPNRLIGVFVKNLPVDLVYQNLSEKLNWEVSCFNNWLMFSHKESTKLPDIPRLFSNFMIKREIIDNKTVHIVWENGVTYQGGYEDGMAQGIGKYTFFNNDNPERIVEGTFENGKLEGQGKDYYEDGIFSYVGEYHNGLFHGQGHLIDKYEQIDNKGQFIKGEFIYNKTREKYYIRDSKKQEPTSYPIDYELIGQNMKQLNNYILYKGPFLKDEPSGKGHCYLKETSYDCTFYKGYLIGIDDFSLLPSNISIN